MKLLTLLLALFAGLIALPAAAQGLSNQYYAGYAGEPDTQALAFITIPLGKQTQPAVPRIGFGIFADCSRLSSQLSPTQRPACDAEPIRSLEFSRGLYDRDWLLSFSGAKRWVGFARFTPGMGFAHDNVSGPVLSGPRLKGLED